MVHHSAKYNSEDNLLEDKKIFSSKVNKTEKPFKDSLGYPRRIHWIRCIRQIRWVRHIRRIRVLKTAQENTCARVSFLIKLQAWAIASSHDK